MILLTTNFAPTTEGCDDVLQSNLAVARHACGFLWNAKTAAARLDVHERAFEVAWSSWPTGWTEWFRPPRASAK